MYHRCLLNSYILSHFQWSGSVGSVSGLWMGWMALGRCCIIYSLLCENFHYHAYSFSFMKIHILFILFHMQLYNYKKEINIVKRDFVWTCMCYWAFVFTLDLHSHKHKPYVLVVWSPEGSHLALYRWGEGRRMILENKQVKNKKTLNFWKGGIRQYVMGKMPSNWGEC